MHAFHVIRSIAMAKLILIVDDDMHVREILVQRLRSRGHEVHAVGTAAAALEMLKNTSYDVLFLDLIMPRTTGLDVLDSINRLPARPRCVVMSGVADMWKRANPNARVDGVSEAIHVRGNAAHGRRVTPGFPSTPSPRSIHALNFSAIQSPA